jgi:hypothetical protein
MTAIATLYCEILPETSKIGEGIVRAWREIDPKAAEAGRRWGREIQRGIGETTVELKADTAKAKAELDEASKKRDTTIQADADTAKAEAQIDVAARDRKATIEVNADTMMSSVQRSVAQVGPQVGAQLGQSLAGAGASAGPQIGGSLSGAMGPVGTALGAALIVGAAGSLAGIAAALSGVVGLIPAGLAGGVGVLATLVTGLDGVKDAWDAAGKAADSANKDQAEKTKAVASAQKTLKDAVLDEANAQKDVANARKDARQQLEDLNVQMRGGVIDEKQAMLDAQAARRDLATGRFRDSIEYEQAQLRVQQADQRVLESHERNVHLQDRASDANSKGVEQSDQVVAANQRLAKAHENTAIALQNLALAQSKNSSNADAFALAMGKLSPNAQAFINTLQGLKPAWEALKFAVQDSLFAGIGPQLQSLATQYLPVLKQAMSGLAGTMNTAFKDIGAWLSKPETMAAIQAIIANIGSSFQIWSQSLVPFSQAFLTITQVGSGFLPQLGQMVTDGANAFNNFIQQASKSGELQQWMQTGITALREFIKLFPILGKMFLDLAPIGIPILQTIGMLLRAIEPLFAAIGSAGASYQEGVNQFWGSVGRLADKLGELVKVVWPPLHSMLVTMERVFSRVFDTISKAIDKAWKFIKPILDAFKNTLGGLDPSGLLSKLGGLVSGKFGDIFSGPGPTPGAPTTPGAPGGRGGIPGLQGTGSTSIPGAPIVVVPGSSWGRSSPGSTLDVAGQASRGGGIPGASPLPSSGAPSGFNWDAVMPHEGGTWNNADTGRNGHYGGLQFAPDTWAAYGGLEFAPRADQATPEQQKIIADRTAFTGWHGKPPQGLGAWQAITEGKVPGITTGSRPPAGMPGASAGQGFNLSNLPDVKGAHPQLAAALAAAQQLFPGLQLTAGKDDHPMDQGWHPKGQAIDIGGGTPQQQAALSNWLLQYAPEIEELIHSGPGVSQNIKSGKVGPAIDMPGSVYNTSQAGDHSDHVHLAITDQQAQAFLAALGSPNLNGMYPSAAGMPTIAAPGGVNPDGSPMGTQNQPYYVMPAQGSSGGQQLGQDMISGIMEIFGFDGSLFKNPMGGGLFKGFKGLMSALTGGGKGGGGASLGSPMGMPGGGGGGDLIGSALNMLPGLVPQPFGDITTGGPAQAPTPFMLTPGGGNTFDPVGGGASSLPGGGLPSGLKMAQPQAPTNNVNQSINFNGPVGNPQAAGQMAKDFNIPRARQGLTGLPGG